MEITEVRIKLVHGSQDRLLAFCSITMDGSFVIRDLKIIQGTRGPFVAMPSRKLMDRCRRCGCKNALRSSYCNQCGTRLPEDRAPKEQDGRAKLYADIAHPINSECREMIQATVIAAFAEETVLAQQPDYICRYDDYGENDSSLPEEYDGIDFEIDARTSGGPAPGGPVPGGQRRVEGAAHEPAQPPHLSQPSERPRAAHREAESGFGEGVK